MNIVFLDVDGVLIIGIPPYNWKTPDPVNIAALNVLLAADPKLMIVVSSCWRVGLTRIELCDLFNEWGVTPGRILDRTGQTCDTRGEEIQEWLTARAKGRDDVEKFVIIDDDADMGTLLHKLVKTDHLVGLTEAHVSQALCILHV